MKKPDKKAKQLERELSQLVESQQAELEQLREKQIDEVEMLRQKYVAIKTEQPPRPPSPALASQSGIPSTELKHAFDRNNFWLVISTISSACGLLMGWIWFTQLQSVVFLGLLSIASLVVGYFSFRKYWRNRGGSSQLIVSQRKQELPHGKKQFNSLCIYPNEVLFQDVEKPLGQPKQCLKDNKHYYVHKFDEITNKLIAYVLPDQSYCDPRYFGEKVLGLPAHWKVCRRKQTMLQKFSPFIMILVIIIEWIIIVTTTG